MPRVHTIRKNRKAQQCRKCSKEIAVGEGYKHWSFRYGGKVTRCLKCPHPRPSELTQSGYKQQVYGAQEAFDDAVSSLERDESFPEAIVSLLDDVIQVAEDVKDEYQAGLDEWEHGNWMLEEKVEAAEAWYEALESAKSEIEGMEPDLPDEPGEDASDEEKEEYQSEREQAMESFVNEVEEIANDPLYDCDI